MKTIEDNFTDWESATFGLGYGTGDPHVIGALKDFLALCRQGKHVHAYNYEELEKALTPATAWLLITALVKDDKIEYGTSPRFGWLTPHGERLAKFVGERTVEQLCDLTSTDSDYIHCFADHCNCDDRDCRHANPFWTARS